MNQNESNYPNDVLAQSLAPNRETSAHGATLRATPGTDVCNFIIPGQGGI